MPNFDLQNLLITILVLSFSLSTHEYAHARVAYALGDSTAKDAGRMTLNPLAHLDPLGTLAFLIAHIGWAKPVPVNPANFSKVTPEKGMMWVSLAGPISNFLISFVSAMLFNLVRIVYAIMLAQHTDPEALVYTILGILLSISLAFYYSNITLGIFNLLPIPPLDGSKILAPILPRKALLFLARYQKYFTAGVILLFIFGQSFLGSFLQKIALPFNYVLMKPWTYLADLIIKGVLSL